MKDIITTLETSVKKALFKKSEKFLEVCVRFSKNFRVSIMKDRTIADESMILILQKIKKKLKAGVRFQFFAVISSRRK